MHSKNLVMIVNSNTEETDLLKQLILEEFPVARCLCFRYAEEALFVTTSELKHLPAYTFLFSNDAVIQANKYLMELHSKISRDHSKIVVVADVLPQSVASTFLANGAAFAFQKPISRSDAKLIVTSVLSNSVDFEILVSAHNMT